MPTFELEDSDFAGYIEDDTIKVASVAGVKIKEKPYKDDDGNPVKKVEFHFVIADGSDHDGQPIWGETSTNFNNHPNCKLRNWACAILGTDLPVGYRLDTDVLIGNEVRAVIGLRDYTDKDGNPKQHNFVKDVIPTTDALDRMQSQSDDEEPF